MKVLLELSSREAMDRIADGRLEAFLEGEAYAEAVIEKGARKAKAQKSEPPKAEESPKIEPPKAEEPAKVVEEEITVEALRALCGPLSQSDAHKKMIKDALTAMGASNISSIPVARRAEFRDQVIEISKIEVPKNE